ncbi:MAG: 16S rRNA (cytosine(1402)-N(4))-methyltransferase RsmH [bacterium]|nr:16S rRNA (cytosine(1402)-N(4))-methyltransferase RsmH [bacterium]
MLKKLKIKMHTPVFEKEVIEALRIQEGKKYIDCTAGEGGHMFSIAYRGGNVLGIDADEDQISNLELRIKSSELKSRIILKQGNFAELERIAKENKFFPVDGILVDLGLSMRQLTDSGKGFSFKNEEEILDMRLDGEGKSASDLLMSLNKESLFDLFARNSEELSSEVIAESIVRFRIGRKIEKVGDLIRAIDYGLTQSTQSERKEKVYMRIFQALRIEVNKEFENVQKLLESSKEILVRGGRLVVITFHSREDRIVKMFAQDNKNYFTHMRLNTKSERSFERSAHVRVLEKI